MGQKIVILVGHLGRGGAQRQAYLLARELRQHYGIDAEVWALTYGGEYVEELESAGVPARVLEFRAPICPLRLVRMLYWAIRLRQVARQFKDARVDILLPFTVLPNVVAGLTYRRAGVRLCIWGERSSGSEYVPRPGRIAVRRYRRFIANSTAGVEFLEQHMHVARERISFIPNGVEEPAIDSSVDWRQRLTLNPAQLFVVKIANVTGFKDHATLLRAWKKVQDVWLGDDRPILALAGSYDPDEVYQECLRIVREGGLESTVRFLGSVSDVSSLVHACDLTVFSSPKEGMPNGVLECMVAGKAVVASDLPGIRDALGPNAGQVLVPPGDADRFAETLLDLLRDKDKRDALGKANRARIRAEFSVERMTERFLNIIQENLPFASGKPRREMEPAGKQERAQQAPAVEL